MTSTVNIHLFIIINLHITDLSQQFLHFACKM